LRLRLQLSTRAILRNYLYIPNLQTSLVLIAERLRADTNALRAYELPNMKTSAPFTYNKS
jgi:hypothetical protein